jgi:hypothetical protein
LQILGRRGFKAQSAAGKLELEQLGVQHLPFCSEAAAEALRHAVPQELEKQPLVRPRICKRFG